MIEEKNIRKLARTILFEMHMGPSNANQGEFTDINYGMYNQHGPILDDEEEQDESDPVKVDYVASIQIAEPNYDISSIDDEEVFPSSSKELKNFVNSKIDSSLGLDSDINKVWKKIKSAIEEFSE